MSLSSDTIAAPATALSDSGIGVIRVSGDNAISIVDNIYRTKRKKRLTEYESHTINYGFIYDEDEFIDEVMVSVFKSPKSYTTEDTVEINCHGGVLVIRKIMDLLIQRGARTAEPGEFTKRAFLNGRIDLSRAEAVMDIIHAKNNYALKSSIKQIRGSLYDLIKEIRSEILYEIAFIESALDDPEHISLEGYSDELMKKNESLIRRVESLYSSSDNGKIVKEGINTLILGKPNAGKSSLMNFLIGEDKAIVTDIAGTTRDLLEESISLSGISLNIIDTAGIRETDDLVERIGVERAKNSIQGADLILYVIDSSVKLDDRDEMILELIRNKKVIIVLNKIDLDSAVEEDQVMNFFKSLNQEEKVYHDWNDNLRILKISAKQGIGLDSLEKTIESMFFHGELKMNDQVLLTNLRQKEAVREGLESLMMVKKSIENGMSEDFLSIDLMGAYSSLGLVIGEEVGEDVVNEIFSKFCMGK